MSYYEKYPKFYISTDCIIFGFFDDKLHVLIHPRDIEPGKGEPSLMGGFVADNESVDDAAVRSVKEQTGLKDFYILQVGAYGNVDRDPGERVVSVCYCVLIHANDYTDDMKAKFNATWVEISEVPKLYGDHNRMILNAQTILKQRLNWDPVAFYLIPEKFTQTQLRTLYECILGEELDKRNFGRKFTEENHIINTYEIDKLSSKRGAIQFKFDFDGYKKDNIFNF